MRFSEKKEVLLVEKQTKIASRNNTSTHKKKKKIEYNLHP